MGNFQEFPLGMDFWRRQRLTQMLTPEPEVTPQGPSTLERYRALVEEQPDIREYKPGILRRIAAGAASMGERPEAGEEMLYKPFMREYGAWQQRVKGLGDIAGLETTQAKTQAEMDWRRAQAAAERQRGGAYGAIAKAREYGMGEKAFQRARDLARIAHPTEPKYLESPESYFEVFPGGEPRELGVPPTVKPPAWSTTEEGTRFREQQANARNAANNAARKMLAKLKNNAASVGLSGTQQKAIYDLAMKKTLTENPEFYDLFQRDDTGQFIGLADDFDPRLYQRYLAEIEANTQAAINQAVPGEEEGEEEEDIYDVERVD